MPDLSKTEIAKLSVQERLDALDNLSLIHWPTRGSVPQFRRYLAPERGVAAQDVITDIDPISPHAKDRLGYPTQKPGALLERIIKASSNPGDVVFDPFCGCGTTIYAAETLRRNWVGCDIAILAIRLIREVLAERYRLTEGIQFEVNGIPVSVEQAEELFKHDHGQFQNWAVERAGGFPTQKKTGDRGVDGRIYFEAAEGLREMVISVKGGAIQPRDIRELRGVLTSEPNARLAGFISLREPTRAMREAASEAGMLSFGDNQYARIQLLTVRDMLEQRQEFRTPAKIGSRIATGQMNLLPSTSLRRRAR